MTDEAPPGPGIWNYGTLGNANLTTEALSSLSAQPPRPLPLPQFRYDADPARPNVVSVTQLLR